MWGSLSLRLMDGDPWDLGTFKQTEGAHWALRFVKSLGIVISLSLWGWIGLAGSQDSQITNAVASEASLENRIDDIVSWYHVRERFHGNIQVKVSGQSVYSGSRGLANEAFDVPHEMDSRFMVASISKQFTAAAVMKLVESGQVDLDGVYGDYVPWKGGNSMSEKAWNSIRIRDLMSHSSGAVRDIRPTEYSSMSSYNPFTRSIVMDQVQNYNMFPREPSDSEGHYSNFGFVMLATLVGEVTGKEFHQFLAESFFIPLGMESTGQFHRMFNIKKMADGYNYADTTGKLLKRCCFDATNFVGSHSLYSDAKDLMIWLADLSSGASTVLSQTSVDQMWTPAVKMAGTKNDMYGFGVHIAEWNGYKVIWHDGMEYGYLSYMMTIPELNIQIVVLSNRHDNESFSYNSPYPERLAKRVFEELEIAPKAGE